MRRPTLHVEGKDDFHAIIHLLKLHGFAVDLRPRPANCPEVIEAGDVDKLLEGMEVAVKAATGTAVGFVLDADESAASRWQSVIERLGRVGVAVPPEPVSGGFIGESTKYLARVGVWLMPDNRSGGILEDFLRALVDEGDRLLDHARSATQKACEIGAAFRGVDTFKAVLHTWLAWQQTPGLPFGTAIHARYFKHDGPAALGFVKWVRVVVDQLPASISTGL
jgi:hypothetical protein